MTKQSKPSRYCEVCGMKMDYQRASKKTCSTACRLKKHHGADHYLNDSIYKFLDSSLVIEKAVLDRGFHLTESEVKMIENAIEIMKIVTQQKYQLEMFKYGESN